MGAAEDQGGAESGTSEGRAGDRGSLHSAAHGRQRRLCGGGGQRRRGDCVRDGDAHQGACCVVVALCCGCLCSVYVVSAFV